MNSILSLLRLRNQSLSSSYHAPESQAGQAQCRDAWLWGRRAVFSVSAYQTLKRHNEHKMAGEVYLDHAATTPTDAEVRSAMEPWLWEHFGNPSSRHALGVRTKAAIEHARTQVARAVGADAENVVFTSGATEANNIAILSHARTNRKRGRHVLVGPM